MQVIVVKRRARATGEKRRRKFSDLGRGYFETEWKWHFIVEALLFAVISFASAWPLYAAAHAVNHLLQQT